MHEYNELTFGIEDLSIFFAPESSSDSETNLPLNLGTRIEAKLSCSANLRSNTDLFDYVIEEENSKQEVLSSLEQSITDVLTENLSNDMNAATTVTILPSIGNDTDTNVFDVYFTVTKIFDLSIEDHEDKATFEQAKTFIQATKVLLEEEVVNKESDIKMNSIDCETADTKFVSN